MSSIHRLRPLPPSRVFITHVLRNCLLAAGVVVTSLSVGAVGYHFFERLPWIDAYLNAAMILTGMGPVDKLQTSGGKLFATGYALFAGLVFLFTATLLLTPALRRGLHKMHLDMQTD